MSIPCYPDFVPLGIEHKDLLHPRLSLTPDGVSEFTFAGLYLFRKRYKYRISQFSLAGTQQTGGFIISGTQPDHVEHGASGAASGENTSAASGGNTGAAAGGKTFFMTPCAAPEKEMLASLFDSHDYWKNISETVLNPVREKLEESGIKIEEDRNNFDYLYYRKDLAELSGKKFHKKKNHVNNFLSSYPNHEQRPLSSALIPAAVEILDRWRQEKNEDGDYKAAREALELFDSVALKGSIFYIDGRPAAFCMGESIARGRMFVVHIEKAIDEYKGIYQFINQAFAASLPRFFTLINREQDLGSEGMRQAKMTYRPCGYVKKFTAVIKEVDENK